MSRRPRWRRSFRDGDGLGAGERAVRESGAIDVHVVTRERARPGPLLRRAELLGRSRRAAGWALAVLGPVALAAILVSFRDLRELPSDLSCSSHSPWGWHCWAGCGRR
ncbi:hypothetical protein [Jiangella gansuensis]|uniref:hypothetical protein n=1 Tax=Jiangella gansuensis TaxID=281473 RepID=UPI0004B76174|nr:hypothetical protein [Jiangella gansuensis]